MRWRSLVLAHDEAGHLKVALGFVGLVGVEESQPDLVELMIEVSIERRKTNAMVSNEFICRQGIVVKGLNDELHSLQLVLVHEELAEGETLVPDNGVRVVLLHGDLGREAGAGDLNEGVGGAGGVFALEVAPLDDSHAHEVFFLVHLNDYTRSEA